MLPDDSKLLDSFIATCDETAFRTLLDRHLAFVHSVARRVTASEELARDVTQDTFIRLAAKAATIPRELGLPAWLHRTARSLAANLVRAEVRRKNRELAAMKLADMEKADTHWSQLAPVIDELVDRLPAIDRRLILQRYYMGLSHAALAGELGMKEEAARRRVSRALEKLRNLLNKQGITTTAAALGVLLPAHAVGTSPPGMAVTLSSLALASHPAPALGISEQFISLMQNTKTTVLMKPMLLLPPALSLVAACAWLASQQQALVALESKNASLSTALHSGPDSPAAATVSLNSKPAASHRVTGANGLIDWKLLTDSEGVANSLAWLEFRESIKTMTAEELVANLDSLDAAGVGDWSASLASEMIPQLSRLDPQLTLDHFADRLTVDHEVSGELVRAMRELAGKDPAAAIAWLNRAIDDGKLEDEGLAAAGKSLRHYEAALIGGLLRHDFAAAVARIHELPEDERAALFKSGVYLDQLAPGTEQAALDLIRASVPEQEQLASIARATTDLSSPRQGLNLGRLDSFLSATEPTAAERAAIIESAVRYAGDRGYIDYAQSWILKQAPEDFDRLTGMVLAGRVNSNNGLYFDGMAELALKHQASSGTDKVMIEFLGNLTHTWEIDKARKLVESVKDESQRVRLSAHLDQVIRR